MRRQGCHGGGKVRSLQPSMPLDLKQKIIRAFARAMQRLPITYWPEAGRALRGWIVTRSARRQLAASARRNSLDEIGTGWLAIAEVAAPLAA
jgi:hypothetical protein